MPAPPTAAANETMPLARAAFMDIISAALECLANHVARLSRRLCLSVGCQQLEKPDLIDFRLDFSCCRGSSPPVSSSARLSSSSSSSSPFLILHTILSFRSFLNPFLLACLNLHSLLDLWRPSSSPPSPFCLFLFSPPLTHSLSSFWSLLIHSFLYTFLSLTRSVIFSPSRFPSTFLPPSFSSPCPCLFLSFDLPVVFPPTLPLLLSSLPFCFSLL